MKVVINAEFGGFGVSQSGYEKLIEWGVPVRRYVRPARNQETGLCEKEPDEQVIYDENLVPESERDQSWQIRSRAIGRYWDSWLSENRSHPLLVRLVEELGEAASGDCADLKIVEIPDDVKWQIEEYDGLEHVAEVHRCWSYLP